MAEENQDIEQFEEVLNPEKTEPEATQKEVQEPEKSSVVDDIAPRYKGKSIEDVIKMHQEAERLMSRHAQEVGEVRKLADELIKSQLKPKVEEEKPKVDFFENPEEAIRQAVESNPKVRQAEEYALSVRREQARQTLLSKHPDAIDLAKTEDFRNWIMASKVRQKLAVEADQGFDVDAADELYSTYKALHKPKTVDPVEKANREDALKQVATERGGSGESSRKIYRRADLIMLKVTKPQEFERRKDEIERAYAEGRVR